MQRIKYSKYLQSRSNQSCNKLTYFHFQTIEHSKNIKFLKDVISNHYLDFNNKGFEKMEEFYVLLVKKVIPEKNIWENE